MAGADVVIEASRPRALEQLGLAPELSRGPPGQVWLSITGHGRVGEARCWTGYGDDCAVAGGFFSRDDAGRPVFCGDAVADPLTGLVAALAVLRGLDAGGGLLIDISLSGVAAWISAGCSPPAVAVARTTAGGWEVRGDGWQEEVAETAPLELFQGDPSAGGYPRADGRAGALRRGRRSS
jgi:crotonobetainyl-CoA:carnitine CoA-transferase CaiB-like acyl-CoA transferase